MITEMTKEQLDEKVRRIIDLLRHRTGLQFRETYRIKGDWMYVDLTWTGKAFQVECTVSDDIEQPYPYSFEMKLKGDASLEDNDMTSDFLNISKIFKRSDISMGLIDVKNNFKLNEKMKVDNEQ
jgi:hypothetical protein